MSRKCQFGYLAAVIGTMTMMAMIVMGSCKTLFAVNVATAEQTRNGLRWILYKGLLLRVAGGKEGSERDRIE